MTGLLWDNIEERQLETGINKGVLYLSDNSGVAWSGLLSVDEDFGDDSSTPIYFYGVKVSDSQSIGDFKAKLQAITYPDEFIEYDGLGYLVDGLYADDQMPKQFGLSYQTQVIGSSEVLGYKIHILYNLMAVDDVLTHDTSTDYDALVAFDWTMYGVPMDAPGFKSTSHIIFDTRYIHPFLVSDIEDILYGDETHDAYLPSISEWFEIFENFDLITVTDNGDGTWTAEGPDEYFSFPEDGLFEITSIGGHIIDAGTYALAVDD